MNNVKNVSTESIDHDSYHRLERMFVDGYLSARDKLVFLRLAHIPFQLHATADGDETTTLYLKAIKIEDLFEVGSVTPAFATDQVLHQMYPDEMVSSQHSLRFIYVRPDGIVEKSLNELLGLIIEDAAEHDQK